MTNGERATNGTAMELNHPVRSCGAQRDISSRTMREAVAILLFSTILGARFMHVPTVSEFLWSFSKFIDVVLEVPQLKRVFSSETLDEWIVAYYSCIGSRAVLCIVDLVYRFVECQNTFRRENLFDVILPPYRRDKGRYVFDNITPGTTISKGFIIATFFVARLYNQRRRGPLGGYEVIPP